MNDGLTIALGALGQIADPLRFFYLICGVLMGLVVGVVPGIGGLVALSLLLPFTFQLDPLTALAMLIGMHAAVATSDSIPAILFGVPGTVGSAATVVDGHQMARNGEAGRALGAAFTASLLGGILGVAALAALLPVLRPLMLSIGSPEMLALCLFGLSLAAGLSGGRMLPGLAAVCIGLLLSMVGEDYQTGTLRWTFDTFYLWEGIPLVPLALGLFALPELADLALNRRGVAKIEVGATRGRLQGFGDVVRNPAVLLRSSGIGALLGAMPGIGSAVIDWVAYGATARSKLPDARFGRGDVRGVIASESANNAKEGGALVPTIAFGVPGSAAMAILLGAFMVHGINPGPEMLGKSLDVTYVLILSVAIANIVGAAICFLFAPALARMALVPVGFLVPIVLGITFIGAFQGAHHWGDLIVLIGAGLLGHAMRRLGWPRPPLILAFVLGILIERYMATSIQIYGAGFLLRPLVLLVLLFTIWGVLKPLWLDIAARLRRAHPPLVASGGIRPMRITPDTILAAAMLVVFVLALVWTASWKPAAALMPRIAAWAGVGLMTLHIGHSLFFPGSSWSANGWVDARTPDEDAATCPRSLWVRGVGYFGAILAYGALAWLVGPLAALPVWIAAYARIGFRISWRAAIVTGVVAFVLAFAVFELLLGSQFPRPLFTLL